MTIRFEIKYYAPTEKRGERVRVKGLANKFYPYNYEYNSAVEQGLALIKDFGYSEAQIMAIIPTNSGGIVLAERW